MSDEELELYIKDSLATIFILSESHSERLAAVKEDFVADLVRLVSLGRLSPDDYNEITTNLDELS